MNATAEPTTKHTPGPWEVSGGYINSASAIKSNGAPIAVADPYVDAAFLPDAEVDANARLIAAAPELLEALRGLLAELGDRTASNCFGGLGAACDSARSVIAKATGNQS